jgi:Adenylate and Guanylate cyclase catalytic domain
MESTGERDKIQVSQATAALLIESGRSRWIQKRDSPVTVKGKGEMQTYFLVGSSRPQGGADCRSVGSDGVTDNGKKDDLWGGEEEIPDVVTQQRSKHQRLVDYNVDLLSHHLKKVVARRMMIQMSGRRASTGDFPPNLDAHRGELGTDRPMPIEEVSETIRLPSFDARTSKIQIQPESIELDPRVVSQLKRFVSIVAAMYRNNSFHNFGESRGTRTKLSHTLRPDINLCSFFSFQSMHPTL